MEILKFGKFKGEAGLLVSISFLVTLSVVILSSIAPAVFPVYWIYLAIGILSFLFFSQLDFEILKAFSGAGYIASIILLILPLLIGQVTRGAVRWIPIGELTIQPAEIVRPFLIIYFASFLTHKLTNKRLVKALVLAAIPLFLILIQPSLGVTVLTFISFVGVIISLNFNKKLLLGAFLATLAAIPLLWLMLAPYQKLRIEALISPAKDPFGAGYNSIQSMISVGSGGLIGRGLGEGVQTQLSFLPERHTDFIFASIAEELGFLGAFLLMAATALMLYRIVSIVDWSADYTARAFVSGVFLVLLAQTIVHIGMNMGLFPITGLPYPLVSAGGSSLIATLTMLGMVLSAKKN